MSAIVPKSQRAHYLMITAIAKYLKKWTLYKCVRFTLNTLRRRNNDILGS